MGSKHYNPAYAAEAYGAALDEIEKALEQGKEPKISHKTIGLLKAYADWRNRNKSKYFAVGIVLALIVFGKPVYEFLPILIVYWGLVYLAYTNLWMFVKGLRSRETPATRILDAHIKKEFLTTWEFLR